MKSITLILVLILAGLPGLAQKFIGQPKSRVKEDLKKYESPASYKSAITSESDSTLNFQIKGTGDLQASMLFLFDKKGNCYTEKVSATCDSCLLVYLRPVLNNSKYHWKQINENQYVSDFESRLMIELEPEKGKHSYRVMRMDWSRELYDILMQK